MKKILITGLNSYVGTSLVNWLENYSEKYYVDSISVRDDLWRRKNFSDYDVVFHVAGIAHIKETRNNAELYFKVNRNLVFEIAKKAKKEGVKQFIFLSSMSVYGVDSGVIEENTPLNPKSNYGRSKLEAENLITLLGDDVFKVAIIRPPMIYGKGCKGNYPRLAKLSLKVRLFPNIKNIRSMIYIDNLCEFIRLLIDSGNGGLFFPQNTEYVCTSYMVRLINEVHGRKILTTRLFNPFLKLIRTNTFNKVFGDLVYDKKLSEDITKQKISFINFEDTIKLTEE
nr:NAD-dependent epimerase/dehydratase family protein [Neobacillus sp. Marseille-Q6967]